MLTLTQEQQDVADQIMAFASGQHREAYKQGYLTVAGYAGTGKTTVLGSAFAQFLRCRSEFPIAYCAPTGKAASVLRTKLEAFKALNDSSSVRTVHGHIYSLQKSKPYDLQWRKKVDRPPYDLMVVDEASMITSAMFADLLSYGIPTIFVGDAGQLPPVGDKAFQPLLTTRYRLNTVHRQALENPIVRWATAVRNGGTVPYCNSPSFLKIRRTHTQARRITNMFIEKILSADTMLLCGLNQTRLNVNKSVRTALGFAGLGLLPQAGERLICLRNEAKFGLYNGQICTVVEQCGYGVNDSCYRVRLDTGQEVLAYTRALNSRNGQILRQNLYEDHKAIAANLELSEQEQPCLFDYGYACSVHKAQGSEWQNVLLFDERTQYMDDAQYACWLYTGMTRAKDKLCILA